MIKLVNLRIWTALLVFIGVLPLPCQAARHDELGKAYLGFVCDGPVSATVVSAKGAPITVQYHLISEVDDHDANNKQAPFPIQILRFDLPQGRYKLMQVSCRGVDCHNTLVSDTSSPQPITTFEVVASKARARGVFEMIERQESGFLFLPQTTYQPVVHPFSKAILEIIRKDAARAR